MLLQPATLRDLEAAAQTVFQTDAYLDRAIRLAFALIRTKGEVDDATYFHAQQKLLSLISGDSLAASPGTPNFRAAAYRLLEFAERVVKLRGASGLVVLIDEVESIFTKLHNRLSTRGAFRVLAALLYGVNAPGLRVALGVTNDGWSWLTTAVERYWESSCTPHEALSKLPGILRKTPAVPCGHLDATALRGVLDRVKLLHAAVYGAVCTQERWTHQRNEIARRVPSPRIAIRDAINFLDAFRFQA
jgi:hypothetical protein